jgi:hypothetical protein
VVRFIAAQEVGVFIRGPRGAARSLVAEQLTPLAPMLSEQLGTTFDPNSEYFFVKNLSARYVNEADQDRIFTWLAAETERYVSALGEV